MNVRGIAQVIGPVVVAVVAWLGLGLAPWVLSDHDERAVAIEEEHGRLTVEIAAAQRRSEAVPAYEARRAEADRAVPPTIDLAAFVRATDAAADRTGVAIEQMAPLQVSSGSEGGTAAPLPAGTSSITISLGASGSYPQVLAFAEALGDLDRLVVVDHIDVNADEAQTSRLILDVELRIFTTDRLSTGSALAQELGTSTDGTIDGSADDPQAVSAG